MRLLLALMLMPLAALAAPPPGEPVDVDVIESCQIGGCSAQLCAEAAGISTCEFRPEYECYQVWGECGPLPGGGCGWSGPELAACLEAHGVCPERHEPSCNEGQQPICLVGQSSPNGCAPARYCICSGRHTAIRVSTVEDPESGVEPVTVISVGEPIDLDFGRPTMPKLELPSLGPLGPELPY